MANVIEKPSGSIETVAQDNAHSPVDDVLRAFEHVAEDESDNRGFFSWPPTAAMVSTILVIVVLGAFITYVAMSKRDSAQSAANAPVATAPSAPAVRVRSTTPAPPMSATEIKEMQARDTYATNMAKSFPARMPEYKKVLIFADNWAGTKPPYPTPLTDIKQRTGDNLMLVFWSPDAGTAKALAEFTKSRAVTEAVSAGFAEFQFVDPATYCYASVVPVNIVGPVNCGVR